MKKLLYIVLVIAMLLGIVSGCRKTPSANTPAGGADTTTTPPESNDPLALLEAAGEKLRQAKSFETEMWKWTWTGYTQPDWKPYSPDDPKNISWKMQYVADQNGAPASCLTQVYYGDQWFFFGETGYSTDGQYKVKHISDESFTQDKHFWFLYAGIDIYKSKIFEEFCSTEPTVTKAENGSKSFSVEYEIFEELQTLFNVPNPMSAGIYEYGENRIGIGAHYYVESKRKFEVIFTIDSQGYLQEIRVDCMSPLNDGSGYATTHVFGISFSGFNEDVQIQEPQWASTYLKNNEEKYQLSHHFGSHYQAMYTYNLETNSYELQTVHLYGLDHQDDEHWYYFYKLEEAPCYKVLSQINGVPVSVVHDQCRVGNILSYYAERLVLPKGVRLERNNEVVPGFSMVFVEDTKENAEVIPGSTFDIYYAGQWEYVDGIPTPIQ